MKILHILNTPRAEGTPNLVLDWLSTGLHEQEVYALNRDPADLTEKFRHSACWYEEGTLFRYRWLKFPLIALTVFFICLKRKPDLVICWPTGFGNWVCLGARFSGLKKILVHAGNPAGKGSKSNWLTRYVMWPIWILGGKVVCCSSFVRQTLLDIPFIPKKNLYVKWNGVNLSRFSQAKTTKSADPIAIMVANLEAARDHETAILAASIVSQKIPNFKLHLIGRGSKMEKLHLMIASLSLSNVVKLLGPRDDIALLMHQSTLFLFSTLEEGFGTVLIEAMASGLPIVATEIPACREVLQDGKLGILVPTKDPNMMALAILRCLENPLSEDENKIRRLYAAEFSAERMINDYLTIVM